VPERDIKSEYELVVLFRPELEKDMAPALKSMADLVKNNGGEITAEDDWGRKELAYKIAGETHAVYRVYTVQLPADAPAKLSKVLNITDSVIRYLLTKVDPKVKAVLAEEKERAASRKDNPETEDKSENSDEVNE